MRRFWLLSAVAIVTIALLSIQEGYCGKAVEIDLSKPDQSEVLEEVAKFTGLTKDVVELVNEEHAELFKGLDNTVFAYKVFNLIMEAKDSQALTEVTMKALEVVKDLLVEKAFPAAVGTFFTFASASKATLEIVRDYYWIPKYEEKIYRAYKESRDKDREENIRIAKKSGKKVEDESKYEDTSEEGRDTAFNMGVMNEASGYYVVKGKMLDEMSKEKLNLKSQEEAGERALKIFNKQIDNFWISRLEMRYQKDRLKARQVAIQKEIWEKKAQQLEAVKAAAGQLAGPQRFFIKLPQDLPQGWWKVEPLAKAWNGVPQDQTDINKSSAASWLQCFHCSRDQGFKLERDKEGKPQYVSSKGYGRPSEFNVSTYIYSSAYHPSTLSSLPPGVPVPVMTPQGAYEQLVKDYGYRYLTEMKPAVIRSREGGEVGTNNRVVELHFFKNGYFVELHLSGQNNVNSAPTEAMAIHFANCIASHMESKVKKGK